MFKISSKQAEDLKNISNDFNSESIKSAINEKKSKLTNPWLYNKINFDKVPLANVQKSDPFFHKNLISQMISSFVKFGDNYIMEIDSNIKGYHSRERSVEFLIKSKTGRMLPINIIDPIDEVGIHDKARTAQYDYYFPKLYPMFYYEMINPTDESSFNTEILQMLETVNKEMSIYLY